MAKKPPNSIKIIFKGLIDVAKAVAGKQNTIKTDVPKEKTPSEEGPAPKKEDAPLEKFNDAHEHTIMLDETQIEEIKAFLCYHEITDSLALPCVCDGKRATLTVDIFPHLPENASLETKMQKVVSLRIHTEEDVFGADYILDENVDSVIEIIQADIEELSPEKPIKDDSEPGNTQIPPRVQRPTMDRPEDYFPLDALRRISAERETLPYPQAGNLNFDIPKSSGGIE